MYRAVVAHDPAFEGIFFVGVATTGIFCRPTCRVRTPKRENVEFFASPSDALHAGYRPCRRCRPLDRGRSAPPLVAELLAAVEDAPTGRLRDADLAQRGIDPSTARRTFKRYCGMTFHAYHRARRMGLALAGVRQGKSVLDLQLDHGFESGSGFRGAFNRLVGAAPSRARDVDCLYAQWFETPLGAMLALANDAGLALLEFVDRRGLERELALVERKLKRRILPGTHPLLSQIGDGTCCILCRPDADLQHARSHSPGRRSSARSGTSCVPSPPAQRARTPRSPLRSATPPRCAPSVAPTATTAFASSCPVIASSAPTASLTGYGGGLWRKQWLLEHERVHAGGRGQLPLEAEPRARASIASAPA